MSAASHRNILLGSIVAFVASVIAMPASAQKLQFVFAVDDLAPKSTVPQAASVPERTRTGMLTKVLPAARRHWHGLSGCEGQFTILAAAQGAFTAANSSQSAILYTYCMTGHNFAADGLAVFENRALVANVMFDGAWNSAILPAPDIDGNGRTKLLIVAGGTNMGENWQDISIIGLGEKGVTKFGVVQAYADTCGENLDSGKRTAYKFFVKPARPPHFFREEYQASCQGNGNWIRSGTLQQIALESDTTVYVLVP